MFSSPHVQSLIKVNRYSECARWVLPVNCPVCAGHIGVQAINNGVCSSQESLESSVEGSCTNVNNESMTLGECVL